MAIKIHFVKSYPKKEGLEVFEILMNGKLNTIYPNRTYFLVHKVNKNIIKIYYKD